jgi:uncharacterized membrane protein
LDLNTLFFTALLTLIPIAELRGGLPFALANGIHPLLAYFFCVAINILATPIVFIFLQTVHKILIKWQLYARIFEKIIARAQKKVKVKVDKYGYVGLAIFVGIPLPFTGAYTGALGAWILGMDKKKSFLAISAGVCASGILVYGAVQLGLTFFFSVIK